MEPEYKEIFSKTVLKSDINYVIQKIVACHPSSSGWSHGEPRIISVDDKYVRIEIPLEKYDVNSYKR